MAPDWLTWLADDYFRRPQTIDFVTHHGTAASLSDEDLAFLDGLRDARELFLGHQSTVGDNGIRHASKLHKLEHLDLRGTAITDNGVEAVARLQNLNWLALSNTAVTDAGIVHLSSLRKLRVLALSETSISDASLAALRSLSQLTHLSLLGTHVTANGCKQLQTMLPNCRIVYRDERRSVLNRIRQLRGTINFQPTNAMLPVVFEEMHDDFSEVRGIIVHSLSFTDDELAMLTSIPELRSISLGDTSISDDGMSSIVACLSHLEHIQAENNPHITDVSVAAITRLPNLKSLSLRNTRVSDTGLAMLGDMPKLEQLYVDSPLITDSGVKHLGRLANLQTLHLGGALAGLEFEALAKLKVLKELSLSNTHINDLAVDGLSTITQLTDLVVGGTDISEAGVEKIKKSLPGTRVMYWQNKNDGTLISHQEE
jgi:Leucine-rich repeat (LRR) protein